MKKFLLSLAVLICFLPALFAKDPADSVKLMNEWQRRVDSIEGALHYKTGTVSLGNGIATINVHKGFKFLEAAEAKYVVEDLWGNLKGQSPLGILFPESASATNVDGYAFIVGYEALGYVKDKDADKINYDDLLKEMKENSAKPMKKGQNWVCRK